MTLSYRIVGLVKARISNEFLKASDADAAKALGLSRAAIGDYKHARGVMSAETLGRAQAIIQLSDEEFVDLHLQLAQESAPNAAPIRDAIRRIMEAAKKSAAAILAVIVLGFGAGNTGVSEAVAGAARYTLCARRRKAQRGPWVPGSREHSPPLPTTLSGARLLTFYSRWRGETHRPKERRAVHA